MISKLKCFTALAVTLALLLSATACPARAGEVRNVILMISDGTGVGVSTLSRWMKAYDPATGHFDTSARLNADPYLSGLIRTYCLTPSGEPGAITDSAPGGTALSTGYKSRDKYVGADAQGTPRATVLELAKSLGKSTGLVVTANVQHATPACFAAHTTDRNDFEGIGLQMMETGVDVVLGGGAHYMRGDVRADGRDLLNELTDGGYDLLTTRDELMAYAGERVWGLFAEGYMQYEADRALLAPNEPALHEMTKKAIDILCRNENGFFLMVEGSKVDWAAHNNDPVALVSEFLAFDEAVGRAMEFARGREDTMVLVVEDHGTGGVSIGSAESDRAYASLPLADVIWPLTRSRITSEGVIELLAAGAAPEEALRLYGIWDPTGEELAWARELAPDRNVPTSESRATLGNMLSRRAYIGWTGVGHVGDDVALYSYLPGDGRVTGLIENTDVARIIMEKWGGMTEGACAHAPSEAAQEP